MNNKIFLDENSFIIKNFDVKDKYFILEKDITYNIPIPYNSKFDNYNIISEKNYNIFYEISKHKPLNFNQVNEIDIIPDGNCYYNNYFLKIL